MIDDLDTSLGAAWRPKAALPTRVEREDARDVSYFGGGPPLTRTLQRMTSDDRSERALFALEPRGADLSPGMIHTLAQGGGILVGAIVDGLVRTWVADNDG